MLIMALLLDGQLVKREVYEYKGIFKKAVDDRHCGY